MDAKITLSFNKNVIERAKQYAKAQNISLSRLMEFLLDKATSGSFESIDSLPVSDWVNAVAEGKVEYHRKPRKPKSLKEEYRNRKK
jgi:hypothetical protein